MQRIDYTLQSLDGVFAFILYDEDFNKVFVARDPYGVRPLFECITMTKNQNDVIGYGSELKQLHPMKVIFDKVEIQQFTPGKTGTSNSHIGPMSRRFLTCLTKGTRDRIILSTGAQDNLPL